MMPSVLLVMDAGTIVINVIHEISYVRLIVVLMREQADFMEKQFDRIIVM